MNKSSVDFHGEERWNSIKKETFLQSERERIQRKRRNQFISSVIRFGFKVNAYVAYILMFGVLFFGFGYMVYLSIKQL